MGNTSPVRYDKSMLMRTDQEFRDALERVRKQTKPPLSRTDAVRKLVFDADRKGKKK